MKMDLKHKGISWVGNMFQKFEAVCQEVDNIISQDKVKYVENQVSSASANVKRLYSDVVQGLLPPTGDPMKYEAKALDQRGRAPINPYFRTLSHNEGKAASNVVNTSSMGHDISTTDQIGNWSQASCSVPFVNEEVAQVPNHSSLELNADLPLEMNDDVLLDKDLYENMKANGVRELLSEKSDGTWTDTLTLMESDASDPLSHSVSNVSTEINDTNKRAPSVCDGSDLQSEDDVLLIGNNDGFLADKDASMSSEEDTTMESDASDLLSHSRCNVSTEIDDTNKRASLVCDGSDMQSEDDVLLVGNNDGVLTDKDASKSSEEDATMESDASDPLSHSLSNVSTEIDDTNKRASLVCDGSDMQTEDDVLLVGNNDGVLTDKDASKSSEEDTTMEFNASDPLKHMANHTSCEVKVTNGEAIPILDNSRLPVESSRLSWKNDGDLSNENSDEFLKKVIMEPKTAVHLNENHLSHVWSVTNFVSKEADDSNLLLRSVVLSGRIDHAMMDKDFNKSPVKGAIFEDDPNSYLLNLPSHVDGISFTNDEAIMVSDRNHLQLETEILARKNDDALTVECSNESLKNDTILELEHDASYPLKNQPRCTSSSIKYNNEEVSSVSNDSFLKLESEVGKNIKVLIDKVSDASKEQANLELSTELTLHCGEESIEQTLCSYVNECEGDIVTSNGNPQETSHCADVESIHKVERASNILANNLAGISLRMETTSKYLENGTVYSSNAADATSSELDSVVFTSGETVEETKPVSSLKPLAKGSFSAFRSSVSNLSSNTVVHEKPAEQNAYIECGYRPSFEVVSSPSYGNKASKMKFVSSRSSLSEMESLAGNHASRANDTAFLPKVFTSSQGEFSKSTSSGSPSFSTEGGCPHDSSSFILDAEMETVDLGHKVTIEEECDVIDYKALHAVSRRTQKLRSYKKRLQDAFTSKKRLVKEYEQLAIWYGDTDLEFSPKSSQQLEKENASTSYVSDSEWELL